MHVDDVAPLSSYAPSLEHYIGATSLSVSSHSLIGGMGAIRGAMPLWMTYSTVYDWRWGNDAGLGHFKAFKGINLQGQS